MGVLHGWRFCPRCAASLEHGRGRVDCSACGFAHYANPVPAVAALVVDGRGRLLLARRARPPDEGLWDTPGGFLDEGEHPLDALRRELLEETGLEILVGDFVGALVDVYGEAPDARSVLNLVWEATVAAGEPAPADDVSELRWYVPEELPGDDELAFRWVGPALRAWAADRQRA